MLSTPEIEIDSLEVSYGASKAVQGVSLDVDRGEVFGFLGPNGAGKTSTIRVLLDLVRPTCGSVRVFGKSVADSSELRREIGFLPADLALFGELKGEETLRFFQQLQQCRVSRAPEILEQLGFPFEALSRRVSGYSTGMRQMIGIAVALQHSPRLLILDEPTTGLDPLVRDRFLQILRSERSLGRTVFFSSHILSEVECVADRVALIDRGRLILTDRLEKIQTRSPRSVRYKTRDGVVHTLEHRGSIDGLLSTLPPGLLDLEIRPLDLSGVFRELVGTKK